LSNPDVSSALGRQIDCKQLGDKLMDEGKLQLAPSGRTAREVIRLRLRSGQITAESKKWGNVVFNIRGVIRTTAEVIIGLASVVVAPWVSPFIAILVICDLCEVRKVLITEELAWVLLGFVRADRKTISESDLLHIVSEMRGESGHPPIDLNDLRACLLDLETLYCVRESDDAKGNWTITEAIEIEP
jgi:hypothetical protein